MRIKGKIVIGKEPFDVEYMNNPTSQSLLAQMPFTVQLDDYVGKEKIFHPIIALDQKDAPAGADPTPGDVMCYGPWGNVAIFYKEVGYSKGLIPMGQIENVVGFVNALNSHGSMATFEKEY